MGASTVTSTFAPSFELDFTPFVIDQGVLNPNLFVKRVGSVLDIGLTRVRSDRDSQWDSSALLSSVN
jgi:hypothetical protein